MLCRLNFSGNSGDKLDILFFTGSRWIHHRNFPVRFRDDVYIEKQILRQDDFRQSGNFARILFHLCPYPEREPTRRASGKPLIRGRGLWILED